MSTIQSSDEHLTLNADGTAKEIKLQANGVEKAKVTSTGVDVTGRITTDGITEDASGNVGIGTASPNTKLHIDHSGNKANAIRVGDLTTIGSDTGIYFRTTGNAYISTASTGDHVFDKAGTERMRIDSSGRVTMPYQPHIFGTPGNGTAASSGDATKFAIQTSRGLSFSNNRITVPVAGVYLITFQTIMSDDAGSGRKDSAVRINGTTVSNGLNNASDGGNGDYKMRTHTFTRYLNANDYIQFNSSAWYATGNGFSDWQMASVSLIG